jgi:hypothetical protein
MITTSKPGRGKRQNFTELLKSANLFLTEVVLKLWGFEMG